MKISVSPGQLCRLALIQPKDAQGQPVGDQKLLHKFTGDDSAAQSFTFNGIGSGTIEIIDQALDDWNLRHAVEVSSIQDLDFMTDEAGNKWLVTSL